MNKLLRYLPFKTITVKVKTQEYIFGKPLLGNTNKYWDLVIYINLKK